MLFDEFFAIITLYAGEGHTIKGREISRFWLRRLCEAVLFISSSIIVLYAWARFIPTGYSLPIGEAVGDIAAGVSAIVGFISLLLYFWLPHSKLFIVACVMYGLLVANVGTLIVTSGNLSSPFITAWVPIAIFAGFFGPIALGVAILLVIGLVAYQYATTTQELMTAVSALFFGCMPIALSGIIFRHKHEAAPAQGDTLEDQLSTIQGKSEIVINTIDDGVLAISREGNIELINPAAQRLIGWQQGDALGLKWQSVIQLATVDGQDVPEHENPIAQALTTNRPAHTDKLMMRTNSDKRFLVSIVSSPVGPNNEGVIVVFRDITKEKAEEREQAEFISTASHEMRTPVASIEGYLGLALNPATAQIDDKARDFITKAHESAQHLGRLFQDLLDISKAEDGRLKNEPRVINVNDFLATIFDGLASQAAAKGLEYHYIPNVANTDDGIHALHPVYYSFVDADHLREVASNLIENAIKYTPKGSVTVDITGTDRIVTISVADSGIGIPPEDIPHLFQKFYRVDNSDTREIGGTGLGLYLSRRLAENMGGHLRVESEYKKGSTFFIDIPRMDHAEAAAKLSEQEVVVESPSDTMPLMPATSPELNQNATETTAHIAESAAQNLTEPAVEATAPEMVQYTQQETPLPSQQPTQQATAVEQPAIAAQQPIQTVQSLQSLQSSQSPEAIPQRPYQPPQPRQTPTLAEIERYVRTERPPQA